ncbi:MAG: VWA domain-containing protein [Bacteroidetes bacterium]|nr:VWA domain-containing protein [Bacteroidota bacterium]
MILQSSFSFAQKAKDKEVDAPPPLTRILFIFDCSQSMFGRWQSDTKINIAQKLLSNMLDSLKDVKNLELAFRVYGHQKNFPPQDCDDSKLEIPFSKNNYKKIEHKLKSLVPRGTTPIAFSLEKSADDFPPCKDCRNIVILITDGLEECGGDPCAVSQLLQKKGIILKPFIIGIGKNFKESFDCVGTYFDATSEIEFNKALNVVISQALNSTTAQVNLLDEQGKPTETNVNMTFYDNFSGLIKYNFIHTMNNRGMPDTLSIDPLVKYNLVVHTIPPVKKDSIVLTPGKHSVIALDAPQGYMKLKLMSGSNAISNKNLQCIVRKKGSFETLNVQFFNQTEKYLCGNYDLEVLCLPRLIIKDVEIKQSNTTTVEVPMPGIAVINTVVNGYGSLYVLEDNKMKWIYNLNDNTTMESLILQPGSYRVVFRGKMSTKSISSIDKDFKIESGITTSVNIYKN